MATSEERAPSKNEWHQESVSEEFAALGDSDLDLDLEVDGAFAHVLTLKTRKEELEAALVEIRAEIHDLDRQIEEGEARKHRALFPEGYKP